MLGSLPEKQTAGDYVSVKLSVSAPEFIRTGGVRIKSEAVSMNVSHSQPSLFNNPVL